MAFVVVGRNIKKDGFLPFHITKVNVAHILETETTETAAINNEPQKEYISKNKDDVSKLSPMTTQNYWKYPTHIQRF